MTSEITVTINLSKGDISVSAETPEVLESPDRIQRTLDRLADLAVELATDTLTQARLITEDTLKAEPPARTTAQTEPA